MTIARPMQLTDKPDAGRCGARAARSSSRTSVSAMAARAALLDGLSLTVQPGERIGLVGRSGAGKSTVVNLLLRFFDLEDGRILIDGQDIARRRRSSLRAQISVVTQDTSLLHRSIRANIRYGRPDASEDEIVRRPSTRMPTNSFWSWRTGAAAAATTRMSASAA